MDCREFRNRHVAFVDDLLPGVEMVSMQLHLDECEACRRHDVAIRRSLFLLRNNLREIEPSPDFQARLDARLRELGPVRPAPRSYGPGLGAFASAAASVILFGYLAMLAFEIDGAPEALVLPPVVASAPEPPASPMADRAIVASAVAGVPVWPAMLMAEQAPMQFMNMQFPAATGR